MKSDQLHEYLSKNRSLNVISIDKIKTRFDTYSSWKVVLTKAGQDKREIMKPEMWPKNTIVRPFLPSRQASGGTRNDNIVTRVTNFVPTTSADNLNHRGPKAVSNEPPSPSWRT